MSLLMWECGLKQNQPVRPIVQPPVTPYVGVWIETFAAMIFAPRPKTSLLMWECGLKPVYPIPLRM